MPAPRTNVAPVYPYYTMVCMCMHKSPACSPSTACTSPRISTALVRNAQERDALRGHNYTSADVHEPTCRDIVVEYDDGYDAGGNDEDDDDDDEYENEDKDENLLWNRGSVKNEGIVEAVRDDSHGEDESSGYSTEEELWADAENEQCCENEQRCEREPNAVRSCRHSPSHDDNLIFMFEPPTHDLETAHSPGRLPARDAAGHSARLTYWEWLCAESARDGGGSVYAAAVKPE